jgi:RimJ/RimL family protein N-acetyltransferase
MSFPILETPRLILRVPKLEDLDRWADSAKDIEANRFIGGALSRSMTWRSMMCMIGAWHEVGYAFFSVLEKSTGLWIGRLGPWQPADWPGTEVGYAFHPDAWGKGYALEAGVAAMDYAVDVLKWDTIIHSIDTDNLASRKLAERLGASILGPANLPAPFADVKADKWGQSAEQWRARRQQFSTLILGK